MRCGVWRLGCASVVQARSSVSSSSSSKRTWFPCLRVNCLPAVRSGLICTICVTLAVFDPYSEESALWLEGKLLRQMHRYAHNRNAKLADAQRTVVLVAL